VGVCGEQKPPGRAGKGRFSPHGLPRYGQRNTKASHLLPFIGLRFFMVFIYNYYHV